MYDLAYLVDSHEVEGVGMEGKHQSEENLTDEEVVERWMDYGRQINACLEEADYDQVTALAENREHLLPKLEELAARLSDDQRTRLLDAEEELQQAMQTHRDYMRKKLSGLGRMKLGVRKYARK